MFLAILILLFGFVILIKGADWLVDGASVVAKKLKISDLVIGLTVVAFGTSAPELVVSVFSSVGGNSDIAVANVVGSNIANIFLILGLSAIIFPLVVTKGTVWKEIPLSLLAISLVGIMASDFLIDSLPFSALTRIDGLILLSFFVIFMYYTFGLSQDNFDQNEISEKSNKNLLVAFSMIVGGLIGLVVGGKLVVDNAVMIAQSLGVSASLIGLTIVAVGTSLPELVTSIVAVYKKNCDIAVGNAVGSNIFNVFLVLGLSAFINPLTIAENGLIDIAMGILASLLLFIFMFVGKKRILQRWQGSLFVIIYVIYIVYLIYRG